MLRLFAAVLIGSIAAPAFAQGEANRTVTPEPDAERRQIVPFLEGTDVFVNVPPHDTFFEAQISPNLVVSQNFSDKIDISNADDKRHFAYSVSGDPMVRLRELREFSAPVRTPSYMPKGTFQLLSFRGLPSNAVGLFALQVTVGHHSNGQDGCLYTDQTVVNKECTPKPLNRDAQTAPVNKHDGSFSTNYITFGFRYRRTQLDRTNRGRSDWTVGADVELNPEGFLGGAAIDPELSYLYGQTRISAVAGAATRLDCVCKSRLEARGYVKYIHSAPSTVDPAAFMIRGSCIFDDHGGWGLLVRLYHGQDYYNLAFLENITRFSIGVTYEQDGFFRFKRADERPRR